MQTSAFLLVIAARAGGITRSTGFLLSLLGTAACMAQGSNDASYQSYRCVVLADGGACQARTHPPQARVEERLEPGSYALYLMYLGRSQGDALASAARIGEFPVRRVVRVTQRPLTEREKYERYLGHDIAPAKAEETLSTRLLKPTLEK